MKKLFLMLLMGGFFLTPLAHAGATAYAGNGMAYASAGTTVAYAGSYHVPCAPAPCPPKTTYAPPPCRPTPCIHSAPPPCQRYVTYSRW